MPPVLTVEQAKNKVVQLAISEKDLTSWKDKTKITVKGRISKVGEPRNEGKYRDVWLKQERGDNEPAFLKVTVSKNDWRNDVDKLSEKDVGSEQLFTGVASMWDDRASGETLYSLYGEIGDGSRQRSGGGRYDDPIGRQRRIVGGMILNGYLAKGMLIDEAMVEVTPDRITDFLNRCKEPVSKKAEAKTEESEEAVEDDPFET